MRATRSSLPQAPLRKLTLGNVGQGPELAEDVPEEMDWWSKYYASLQELQGQVGGARPGAGTGGPKARGWGVSHPTDPCVFRALYCSHLLSSSPHF